MIKRGLEPAGARSGSGWVRFVFRRLPPSRLHFYLSTPGFHCRREPASDLACHCSEELEHAIEEIN